MKSKTSFFNGTVFRKNITRFLPTWTIYLLFTLMLFLGVLDRKYPSSAYDQLGDTVMVMVVVNLIYALINAELLFGDLFNSRICNALHAMPLRREAWYLTNIASGFCFALVPNLILALSFIPRLGPNWSAAFVWMLAVDLEYLFFFGLAVFCVFCTGNRFASALVYGLVNFLSLLVGWLAETFYVPLLNGIVFNWAPFHLFCPTIQMADYYNYFLQDNNLQEFRTCWIYLSVIAVVGMAFLVISLQLYRKRKLECAGDFVAIKGLAPIFRILYTLMFCAIFYLIGNLFVSEASRIGFLLVGLVIGHFTGYMLLQRTVKIFNLKSIIGLVTLAVLLLGSMGIVKLDPTGITRWIPSAQEVTKVELCHEDYTYYYVQPLAMTGEDIPTALDLHRQILEETRQDSASDTTEIQIVYTMTDGKQVFRGYEVPMDGVVIKTLNACFSAPEYILRYTDWETCLDSLDQVVVEAKGYSGEEARELLAAIKADCQAGHMTQDWDFHRSESSYAWVSISFDANGTQKAYGVELTIFESAGNTLNWLAEREVEWRYESYENK